MTSTVGLIDTAKLKIKKYIHICILYMIWGKMDTPFWAFLGVDKEINIMYVKNGSPAGTVL